MFHLLEDDHWFYSLILLPSKSDSKEPPYHSSGASTLLCIKSFNLDKNMLDS